MYMLAISRSSSEKFLFSFAAFLVGSFVFFAIEF